MSLTDRLRAVVAPPRKPDVSGVESGFSRTSDAGVESGFSRTSMQAALGGEFRECDGHRSFVVACRRDPDAVHGRVRVGDLASQITAAQGSAPLVSVAAARAPFLFF